MGYGYTWHSTTSSPVSSDLWGPNPSGCTMLCILVRKQAMRIWTASSHVSCKWVLATVEWNQTNWVCLVLHTLTQLDTKASSRTGERLVHLRIRNILVNTRPYPVTMHVTAQETNTHGSQSLQTFPEKNSCVLVAGSHCRDITWRLSSSISSSRLDRYCFNFRTICPSS